MYKYIVLALLLMSPQGYGQCPGGTCPVPSRSVTQRIVTPFFRQPTPSNYATTPIEYQSIPTNYTSSITTAYIPVGTAYPSFTTTSSIPVATASPYITCYPIAIDTPYITRQVIRSTLTPSVATTRSTRSVSFDPVAYHDYLHNGYWGGPRWTYPGEINDHLRRGHGVR